MEIQRHDHQSILRLARNLLISYEPQYSLVGVIKGVLDAAVFTRNPHNFPWATSTWQDHCGQERSIKRTKVKQYVIKMRPRQNEHHFADNIFKFNFINENFVFWFGFHWSWILRVQLTKAQHWLWYWLGAEQATSHYLNQCCPSSQTHIWGTRGYQIRLLYL